MSGEEDVELRDLVTQTLEANGILGKLKAQLRASVFLALDEQDPLKHKAPFRNKDFQKFASSSEGHEVLFLIREFLQHFNLEYSLAVFDAETDYSSDSIVRAALLKRLGLNEDAETLRTPLISEVLQQLRKGQNDKSDVSHSSEIEKKNTDNQTSLQVGTDLISTLSHEDSTDDDSFFSHSTRDKKHKSGKDESSSSEHVLKNTASSVAGTSSLYKNERFESNRSSRDEKVMKGDDSVQDDDYEADFQLSNVTPIGQTPRSARSDAKTIETEEISEVSEAIEGEDLAKSDASQVEDLTTDRTVSPDFVDRTGKIDYLEDIRS